MPPGPWSRAVSRTWPRQSPAWHCGQSATAVRSEPSCAQLRQFIVYQYPLSLCWHSDVTVLALRTGSPVRDLCFVGPEPGREGARREARHLTDRAVDVDGPAAIAADEMVMVVANPGLEASGMTRRLQTADEPRSRQRGKNVIDRLDRDAAEPQQHCAPHLIGRDMAIGLIKRLKHGDAGRGYPQAGLFEALLRVRTAGHEQERSRNTGTSQETESFQLAAQCSIAPASARWTGTRQ